MNIHEKQTIISSIDSSKAQYILALDQGTTSSRAIIFDKQGSIIAVKQQEFNQIFPKPGLVEHDASEIWLSQLSTAKLAISGAKITSANIAAIGITNQRETTVVWNTESGIPIYNAIVWQDRRTAGLINQLKQQNLEPLIKQKTGLILDAYFSASKLQWILDNIPNARELALQNKLACGTIDCWLIWNLTNRRNHVTDETNASRTMLYNIHSHRWDNELLDLFNIPANILPKVVPSSGVLGEASSGLFGRRIPISGVAGDQQAATFGNLCTKPGMVKNTYGTGCFLLMNTGSTAFESKQNLLTTVAATTNNGIISDLYSTSTNIAHNSREIMLHHQYCLEGSVFTGGSIISWLKHGLKIIKHSSQIEELATSVDDSGGVIIIPALTGLGAPYWKQEARGAIFGITRGTTQAHIARAALEAIALQVYDVVQAMLMDTKQAISTLRVDGGACCNNFLMQFQADILDIKVERPKNLELTALGAALLAGIVVGYFDSLPEIIQTWQLDREFIPNMTHTKRQLILQQWKEAINKV